MLSKIIGSLTTTYKVNTHHNKNKTILDVLFHRKIKNVCNSSINLHPKGLGEGYKKYQAFSKEITGGVYARTGYISNFRNSGEEAILMHGNKIGQIALYSHPVENQEKFTVKEFIGHIKNVYNVDLTEKQEPLHVVSCFSISNGVCQNLSNELRREVIGYGDGNALFASLHLEKHFDKETSNIKSIIGDVEKDKFKDLKFKKASIHKFFPHVPENKNV